jgi:hypothetical protein
MPDLLPNRRQILRAACSGAAAVVFPRPARSSISLDQQRRDLIARVAWMGQNLSSASAMVQEWLRHSAIVRAIRNTTFHNSFANYWQFQSDRPLVTETRFGYGKFGVHADPWISTTGHSVDEATNNELNNEEMASLGPAVTALRGGLSFYTPGAAVPSCCPLAKGPRLRFDERGTHQLVHLARIVKGSGEDFADYRPQYYRYFFVDSRYLGRAPGNFESIVAYAYRKKDSDLLITYAIPA